MKSTRKHTSLQPGLLQSAWLLVVLCITLADLAHADCGAAGVALQILGSGGPETGDGRASSGYLLWQDGRARVMVDAGGGSALRFEASGARFGDLEMLLFSHFHVDHSADLPVLVKGSFFTDRARDLPLYGPSGNQIMPGTGEFVRALFGSNGAYRYLGSYLDGGERYRLIPHDIDAAGRQRVQLPSVAGIDASAVPVHHGPIPALAWRVELGGHALVFSGDLSNRRNTLAGLAAGADLLVVHNAIPEHAEEAARNLHLPPSEIGRVAAEAGVQQLVLSHFMLRTLGREEESLRQIRARYDGPVHFAGDLQCFTP